MGVRQSELLCCLDHPDVLIEAGTVLSLDTRGQHVPLNVTSTYRKKEDQRKQQPVGTLQRTSVTSDRLADLGHTVVGVEFSEKGIREFFEENNLPYSEDPVLSIPGARLFKNSEKNIFLYRCDLFSFSSSVAGQFGAIWDRGSLVAINPNDRERYPGLIVSLMAADCRYLLDTLLYDPEKYGGPPFLVPDAQVQSLFGSCCDVKHLQSVDALTDRTRAWGLDFLTENVHLITLKDAGAQTEPR